MPFGNMEDLEPIAIPWTQFCVSFERFFDKALGAHTQLQKSLGI